MGDSQVENILTLLHSIRHLFPAVPSNSKITRGEYMALHVIRKIGKQEGDAPSKVRISELCKMAHISKSAISQMLRSLEKKELIIRSVDEHDRRAVFVSLTPKGAEFLETSKKEIHDRVQRIIDKIGSEDTDQFIAFLGRLYNAMHEVLNEELMENMKESEEKK